MGAIVPESDMARAGMTQNVTALAAGHAGAVRLAPRTQAACARNLHACVVLGRGDQPYACWLQKRCGPSCTAIDLVQRVPDRVIAEQRSSVSTVWSSSGLKSE